MVLMSRVQKAVCISLSPNALGKGMNPSSLPQLWVNIGLSQIISTLIKYNLFMNNSTMN